MNLIVYKIGEFSNKTNVPIKTLRYYDEIDLFKPSYIDDFTGYRYYEISQIGEIKKIIKLKELNLSLKEIKEYLETNDINILLNKEMEFKMKVEAIKNYVDDISYEFKKGTYDDFIKWNGLRVSHTPAALEIKDNNADYYMIFKNGEYDEDFFIYINDDNLSSITNTRIIYDNLNQVLEFLKDKYDYLTLTINDEKRINIIRENCKIISEEDLEQEGWDGTIWHFKQFKIALKDNLVK